jgi:hypothetical protein
MEYKEYEKEVFEWLMAKNKKDEKFTFSLRVNGSKGSELDYFIGTKKSQYFATTFWFIPVGFPGSSGDCIDVVFKYSGKGFKYYIEFNQTNSPHDAQNTSALNLAKSLRDPINEAFGLSYESNLENKIGSITDTVGSQILTYHR